MENQSPENQPAESIYLVNNRLTEEAKAYVLKSMNDGLSMVDIAATIGVSRTTLDRMFASQLSIAILAPLVAVDLTKGKILATNHPVLARAVGMDKGQE